MPVDYNTFYERLEEKVTEGLVILKTLTIASESYEKILSNLITTAHLIKNFGDIVPGGNSNGEEQKEGIKIGDNYMSLDGSPDDRKMVIFSSSTCSFCVKMKPVYIPYLEENRIPFELVNLDNKDAQDVARDLGINGIPAYLMVKDGKVTYRFEGYNASASSEENIKMLSELIAKYL